MVYVPLGIQLIESTVRCRSVQIKRRNYAMWIWILSFWVYTTYHLSRKPISVVKNVLNQNCSKLKPIPVTNNSHWCDWKPFDGDDSSSLLGMLDSAYLFTYAFGMFFSGMIAERMNLSIFLFAGMILSGLMTCAFGLGKTFNIHALSYYFVVQMLCGVVQSTGWPGVVTAMGNWFGKKKRGLIMGIWNSHTSLGNILGTLIANAFIISGWDMSFIVPGLVIAATGGIVLLFLVPEPTMVCLENPNALQLLADRTSREEAQGLLNEAEDDTLHDKFTGDGEAVLPNSEEKSAISFCRALRIPGVAEFSTSLFFSKLVSYTFLYWLPHYILENTTSNASQSANISTLFDVGGIVGAIVAGVISDSTRKPGLTCAFMLVVSTPLLFVYQLLVTRSSPLVNMVLLLPVGLFVNGPYALITTAVSAELGTHHTLQGNSKALSTVTSIIDGTGSLGAAVGPLLAGVISSSGNWSLVFYMLMGANVISLLCLVRIIRRELWSYLRHR